MRSAMSTGLTKRIEAAAQLWLATRGFKPVEREISVGPSWRADVAGVCSPTRTDAERLRLIPRRRRRGAVEQDYLRREERYSDLPPIITAIVEVKTSRGDFAKDRKWRAASPVHMRILSVPSGLIRDELLPLDWWILEHSRTGTVRRLRRPGQLVKAPAGNLVNILHELAQKAHDRTTHIWWRDVQARQRAHLAQRRTASTVIQACKILQRVAEGEKAADVIADFFYGGDDELVSRVERIRALFASGVTENGE